MFGVIISVALLAYIGHRRLTPDEVRDFLWESWRFIKQIFPLLVVGVFFVGIIRVLIRPEWIKALAGQNTLFGNLAGVVFGVFMYFPTLVEVPIAKMFLSLGMHRGPLLAYLMADPELSLQSILMISAIIGKAKAWVYVFWVALFSTIAGLIYGALEDGANIGTVALYLLIFLALMAAGLWRMSKRSRSPARGRACEGEGGVTYGSAKKSSRRNEMAIRILGPGCPRCHEVEKRTINVLAELGLAADVQKISDIKKIMEYDILSTPGLVIDGKVVCSGRIPRPEEIKAWIQEASA